MFLEKLSVIGYLGEILRLDVVQGIGKGHLAMPVMMTVGFAVCRNVRQLRPWAGIRVGAHQASGEFFAVIQQFLEGYGLGDRAIVEEDVQRSSARRTK